MPIVKYDDPVKSFSQKLTESMNEALKKELDVIIADFTKQAEEQIKKKAAEIAVKGGTWIMEQMVMLPWRDGYEIRIFVGGDKETK